MAAVDLRDFNKMRLGSLPPEQTVIPAIYLLRRRAPHRICSAPAPPFVTVAATDVGKRRATFDIRQRPIVRVTIPRAIQEENFGAGGRKEIHQIRKTIGGNG